MRRFLFFLRLFLVHVFFLILIACSSENKTEQGTTSGIRFEDGNFAAALNKAREMNRILLVDFYSDT